MTRLALIGLVALTLCLSACGKRLRNLEPPDPESSPYPAHYPPADDPGTRL